MQEQEGIVQFFQHAHHRIEGWLIEFQEALDAGHLDVSLIDLAAETLRLHMYTEEELIFPHVKHVLAQPIADLLEQHGRISDLMNELHGLLHRGADISRVKKPFSFLFNVLAAHCSAEDLGIYPDLVSVLGAGKAHALLREADKAEVPPGWVCSSRR